MVVSANTILDYHNSLNPIKLTVMASKSSPRLTNRNLWVAVIGRGPADDLFLEPPISFSLLFLSLSVHIVTGKKKKKTDKTTTYRCG
jgi:hypothetical protein